MSCILNENTVITGYFTLYNRHYTILTVKYELSFSEASIKQEVLLREQFLSQ